MSSLVLIRIRGSLAVKARLRNDFGRIVCPSMVSLGHSSGRRREVIGRGDIEIVIRPGFAHRRVVGGGMQSVEGGRSVVSGVGELQLSTDGKSLLVLFGLLLVYFVPGFVLGVDGFAARDYPHSFRPFTLSTLVISTMSGSRRGLPLRCRAEVQAQAGTSAAASRESCRRPPTRLTECCTAPRVSNWACRAGRTTRSAWTRQGCPA